MRNLLLVAKLDIKESIKSKWFFIYSIVFGGLMALFFITGITNAVVMGFSGLSRILLIYMQVTIIILPIFILTTTVKSIAGDKESNILEYMLSFPVSLKAYYWGKMLGRFLTVFLPVIIALFLGVVWGVLKGGALPYNMLILYSCLLFGLSFSFLGIAFFISSIVRSHDVAIGASFVVWIVMLAFIDVALIGLMLQDRVSDNLIITISLLNPMEVFRVGAISLFDPDLTVIGPVAYYLLDNFGHTLFIIYSVAYPIIVGALFAIFGFVSFKKKDIL